MNPYNTSDIFGGSFNASAHYDAVKVQLASPETIRSWSHGEVKNPETIATAIKIGNPVSWEKSLRAVKWSNGTVEQVTEQEIMDAKAKLDAAGIGAEPASCCSLAGAKKLADKGIIGKDETVVGILTGNILKDPDAVIGYHKDTLGDKGIRGTFANKPQQIPPTLEAVKKALGV